jgi:pimeloyl-ACP methyl ester carboxylesterase
LTGEWTGGFAISGVATGGRVRFQPGGKLTFMTLRADGMPDQLSGSVSAPDSNNIVKFQLALAGATVEFSGEATGNTLKGSAVRNGAAGSFEFFRVAQIPTQDMLKYAGSYRLTGARSIGIGRLQIPGQIDFLVYADVTSGKIGILTPLSETEFVSGPAIMDDYPFETRVAFHRGPAGWTSLTWKEGGRESQAARTPIDEIPVRFTSGDLQLGGTLLVPRSSRTVPAMVMVPGSNPQTRYGLGPDPYIVAGSGVAVLIYDKRGCGESGGNCQRDYPVPVLSQDLSAAVQFLKTQSKIDPRKIGLFGISQGGWVVPAAAAHSADVAFAITIAASGLPTDGNNEYEIDSELRLRNFSADARQQMRQLEDLRWKTVRSGGDDWNTFRDAVSKASKENWFGFARLPRSFLEMNDANRERIMSWVKQEASTIYDPVPDWEKIHVPVLAMYGEYDKDVPPVQSSQILDAALKKAGNRHYTVKVYPKANHGLWRLEKDALSARLSYRFGYDLILEWLKANILSSRASHLP